MWSLKGRIRVLHQKIKFQLTVTTVFSENQKGKIDRGKWRICLCRRKRERLIERQKRKKKYGQVCVREKEIMIRWRKEREIIVMCVYVLNREKGD